MNVAIITYRCGGPGGIESIAASLGSALTRRGIGLEVVCSDPVEIPPGAVLIRVPSVPRPGSLRHLSFRISSTSAARRLRCDIVHSFGMTDHFNVFAAQSCHRAGVRILRSYEKLLVENPFGLGLANMLALHQERRNFSVTPGQKIIACSNRTKREIVEEYGTDENRISVVPDGVDVERFANSSVKKENGKKKFAALGIPGSEPVLIFIANEFARKGLAALIRALPMIRGSAPSLVVVGNDAPEPYRALAREYALHSRIFFTGVRTDIEELLAASDAFVLPTLHEAFGLVILEAMAAGIPVVASACAGAVEDLGLDGVNCLALKTPEQPEEIGAAIQRLLDDNDLRKKMKSEGIATATKYSWDNIAEQTIRVYEELV